MNCKQGDLVILVKSWAGNEGKIFTCLRLATQSEINKHSFKLDSGPVWLIDRAIKTNHGEMVHLAFDKNLRPIRPSEGQDETLSWKDVPQGEIA